VYNYNVESSAIKLVAVSGGIDSVVLLDMLVKAGERVVVAHFDHGIRPDSVADARFVRALARYYDVPFVTHREELGEHASEAVARARRYAFLRKEAKRAGAIIVTAHHANDLIETIAINLMRGTGWRGLAVLHGADIKRLLLGKTKSELYDYALSNRLEWVEDSTNYEPKYLRNRLRRVLNRRIDGKKIQDFRELWQKQIDQRGLIEGELQRFISRNSTYSRYFFILIPELIAMEILQAEIMKRTGKMIQWPQLQRAVLAIKTARPGAAFEVGDGVAIHFSQRKFIVKPPQTML
jgi:tRNA(Ile)-lysidine synthase